MRYEIHQASVSLGGVRILDHVDLTVKGKEKLALTGANGAGKTTTVSMLSTVLLPTEGQILLNGVPLTRRASAGRRGRSLRGSWAC